MRPASPFDDALSDLRVAGSVLLHETYVAPWAVRIPQQEVLRSMLAVDANTRVLPFHLVLEGSFELAYGPAQTKTISAREVAICAGGNEHLMSLGKVRRPTSFADVMTGARPGAAALSTNAGGTTLLCGVFLVADAPLNPLLSSLPPVMTVQTGGNPDNPLLAHAADMLAHEVSRGGRGSFITSRLLEVFCAEAFARHRRGSDAEPAGWFKALCDPKIATALQHLHRDPGRAWSVADLADTVAMSPSRFAARFRERTNISVMSYVARWRMNTALRLLRETGSSLAEIAQQIGYTDVASFSRAFKTLVGVSPSQWRKRQSPKPSSR